ncbi:MULTISPECIES: magnesium transporter CorA family protein [unclassified Clostridium]|uniref:magnesium transporter CorA family protein n=1 Tax=unclassified Clostridium TaxID=2614128 RepID=UPI000298409F|nr:MULTISPECIES: magnesium transporter CorA family protein [unclassified Clostridium]EKQ51682.1 MAG: Mg2+/Co2+ transporter [Clostridium sp. Maddingley MBC34-26]
MTFLSFYYDQKKNKLVKTSTIEIALEKLNQGEFVWLSFNNPTIDKFTTLIEPFKLHPMSIEDIFDENNVPKIDDYPKHCYIQCNAISYLDKQITVEPVNMFFNKNLLVTVIWDSSDKKQPLCDMQKVFESDLSIAKQGPAFAVHSILDHIIDKKLDAIEAIEDELMQIEDDMLNNALDFDLSELQRIRNDLLSLRRSFFHEREILVKICRMDTHYVPENAIIHYKDIYNHVNKFYDETEKCREMLSGIMQTNFALVNIEMSKSANRTNASVRRLTYVTTVFMPLSFFAGVGGMSEWSMMTGSENWMISYPVFLLAMVLIGIGSYFILKWLGRNDEKCI